MKYTIALLLLAALTVCGLGGCKNQDPNAKKEYGVFIGADAENIDLLFDYELVVIDAAYYSGTEIELLHTNGVKVYSYVNIGSLETFRDYYSAYQHLILGEYENWPDEKWVEISQPEWQQHIAEETELLVQKGVDGFFLDNADVYYQYPRADIFRGLVAIINELEKYQKDILINGGDIFVAEAILDTDTPLIHITGVNQECVFSSIDFDNNTTTIQSPDISEYYLAYLERCKAARLSVYLTEYAQNSDYSLRQSISEGCGKYQFRCFVSPSIALDAAGAEPAVDAYGVVLQIDNNVINYYNLLKRCELANKS